MRFAVLIFLNFLMLTAFGQAPTIPASNLYFSNIYCNQMDVNWSNGNGLSRLVFVKENSPLTSVPTQNEFYSSSSIFGKGERLTFDTGAYCVYNGKGSSLTVTGLKSNTTYYASVFEYNGSPPNYEVLTSSFPQEDTITWTIFADFTITPPTQCLNGNNFTFNNSSYSSFPMSFIWNFGDGDTSSKKNVSHQYKSSNIYKVTLEAFSYGCSSTSIKNDTVNPHPQANFDLDPTKTNNDSIQCFYNNQFTFRNKTTILNNRGFTAYQWFVDGIPYTSGFKTDIRFTSPGIKNVKLVAKSDKNCEDSITLAYKVLGNIDADKVSVLPKRMHLSNNSFKLVNNNAAFAIQKWYIQGKTNPLFNDSIMGQSVNYSFKAKGTYYILLKSYDTSLSCKDQILDSVLVYDGLASIPNNQISKPSIYPNPSENGIFKILNLPANSSITVYDLHGKEIFNLSPHKSTIEINLSTFEKGIYHLMVSDPLGKYYLKLIY